MGIKWFKYQAFMQFVDFVLKDINFAPYIGFD